MLAQAIDEKMPLLVHDRIVDGGSAQIHSGYDFHEIVLFQYGDDERTRLADGAGDLLARLAGHYVSFRPADHRGRVTG
jgi:hypothetical protein